MHQQTEQHSDSSSTALPLSIAQASNTALPNPVSDQAIQVGPLPPARPYQCYESRKRSELRTEIIDKVYDLLAMYVHGDSVAPNDLVDDLLSSKKWSSTFGSVTKKHDCKATEMFLSSLLRDYQECKKKETNSLIRRKAQKLKQPIKISGTMSNSQIAFQGKTPQGFRTRTDAAQSMGWLTTYSAERRRLLSIVATYYPQTILTEMFKCSKSTVTAARVHCILFGRGGVPPPSMKLTRQSVSQDTLDQLADFLLRDDISRPSSCRSVVVDGEECPVRYWQSSIKEVIQQYLLEFPGGVKHSYIYGHIPKKLRTNTMLAGLCNLCEDYGYTNFATLKDLQKVRADCQQETKAQELSGIAKTIDVLQR